MLIMLIEEEITEFTIKEREDTNSESYFCNGSGRSAAIWRSADYRGCRNKTRVLI